MSLISKNVNYATKRITIRELAEIAGTTAATVSRALRQKSGVSPRLSQQIIELASHHGYVPNQAARNLVKGGSSFIGYLASDLLNSSYLKTFRVIEKESRKRDYSLLIADSERNPELERQHIEYFLKQGVIGIFIFPVSDWQPTALHGFEFLTTCRIPTIAFGHTPVLGISTVISEEWISSYNLIFALTSVGHRNFVLVGEDPERNSIAANIRLGAITSALPSLGGRICETIYYQSENWIPRVINALQKKNPRPTAIVTINDFMALRLYRPLAEAGISTPGQVSIAAFGNNDWAEYLYPSLTLSEADETSVAETGLSLLFEKLNNPEAAAKHVTVPQKLIMRSSVAAVPKG